MASRTNSTFTGSNLNRREPCAKCGFPVFIAERLNVGTQLYHRTCFRCARCNNQLSLANYYETETDGQYCCETCPDEEMSSNKMPKYDSLDNVKSISDSEHKFEQTHSLSEDTDSKKIDRLEQVKNRSLSDEEKSKGLQQFEDDEYSADFEHALEDSKMYQEESLVSKARSEFLSTQMLNEEIPNIEETKANTEEIKIITEETEVNTEEIEDTSEENINEIPPPLPESKPPDISSSPILREDIIVPESNVNIDISRNDQQKPASEDNLEDSITLRDDTTKDNNRSSLVKSRMLMFELANKNSTHNVTKYSSFIKDSTVPSMDKDISNEENEDKHSHYLSLSSDLLNKSDDANYETVKSDINSDNLACNLVSEDSPSNNLQNKEDKNEEVQAINTVLSKSILEDLTDQSSVAINASLFEEPIALEPTVEEEIYPEDLNPFSSEEDEPKEENDLKKVIKPSMEDLTTITPTKEEKRASTNPFGSSEEEDEPVVVKEKPPRPPLPSTRTEGKKVLEAPKINLNPFWSDEEPSDEEISIKPVPMPRSKHLKTPEPKPRRSGLSNTASHYDSNSSLSSMNSSIGLTPGKKKKPAPLPPMSSLSSLTPEGSKQSSPTTSTHPSPKLAPRLRKNRKAPLPPTSTPKSERIDIPKSEPEDSIILSPSGSDIEKEKIDKDEKNRNRQSQNISSPIMSDTDSLSLSQPCGNDKSTHGKWKRKKGPAPARPVPQRRQIRPLPISELRRELDIIEMQQQGLEKQGVKLEQLIREKCEIPGNNDETALSPEVEDLVLELFELVNEKNELFRRQAELMYLRRQQRLEEEHADLEYQIRCLMERPERNKTDTDKAREEELINRLLEVVERRNEIVECLEMDRVREAEEDQSINTRLNELASKKEEEKLESPVKLSKKEKKKMKKEKKMKEKGKNLDADKDIDESETVVKDKKKKKWF